MDIPGQHASNLSLEHYLFQAAQDIWLSGGSVCSAWQYVSVVWAAMSRRRFSMRRSISFHGFFMFVCNVLRLTTQQTSQVGGLQGIPLVLDGHPERSTWQHFTRLEETWSNHPIAARLNNLIINQCAARIIQKQLALWSLWNDSAWPRTQSQWQYQSSIPQRILCDAGTVQAQASK